jgi:RNA polymerase sigma-70 factor (ECF subfamily)
MERADEELLAAIRAGDDGALEELLARHAPSIYRFGVKMCRDAEDAKDVLQETLLAAARGIREFRGASSLSTWLYSVARSFCIKKRRTSKFAPRDTVSLDDPASTVQPHAPAGEAPDEAAAGRELSALLNHAIASLDPENREVLLLRDVEGLTAAEVADVLGSTVDSVKSRLHRARALVRARLEVHLPPAERAGDRLAPSGCPDVVAAFSRFLEGEIGPADCVAMQAHLASCKRCEAACESLKQTLALCRAQSRGEVPLEMQELVRKALRELAAQAKGT